MRHLQIATSHLRPGLGGNEEPQCNVSGIASHWWRLGLDQLGREGSDSAEVQHRARERERDEEVSKEFS